MTSKLLSSAVKAQLKSPKSRSQKSSNIARQQDGNNQIRKELLAKSSFSHMNPSQHISPMRKSTHFPILSEFPNGSTLRARCARIFDLLLRMIPRIRSAHQHQQRHHFSSSESLHACNEDPTTCKHGEKSFGDGKTFGLHRN